MTPDPKGFWRSRQSKRWSASGQRSAPLFIQEVVEDLEVEETNEARGVSSPWVLLLLWTLSCAGIAFGVRWLIWPGDPSLPQTSDLPTPPQAEIPKRVDLAQLPLIPVDPLATAVGEEFYSGNWHPDWSALGLEDTPPLQELPIEPLQNLPNPLDRLQRDPVLAQETATAKTAREERPSREERPRTVEQLVATLERPTPVAEPVASPSPTPGDDLDSLGPNRGEGTFLVLTTYSGDESLARARQVANGAFVKTINGQKFVQMAAFEQLEYARYHAETLKNQGFNVTIVEQ